MNRLPTVAAGVVILAAIAFSGWQQIQIRRLVAENTRLQSENAQLPPLKADLERLRPLAADPTELPRLRESFAQAQKELISLRGRASEAGQARAEAAELRAELARQPDSETGGETTNQISGAMGEMMKSAMEQQLLGRLTRLQERLNLSPEQAQGIEDILKRQASQAAEAMEKVFAGKMKPGDLASLRQTDAGPVDEQIAALLSPEQKAAYEDYQKEEAVSNARLVSNAEVLQMQNALGLSQSQQDQVYAILYDQNLAQLKGQMASSPGAAASTPADVMQGFLDQKVKALEAVLTPSQLERYRQQQQAQIKFLQTMTGTGGKAAGAGAAASDNIPSP